MEELVAVEEAGGDLLPPASFCAKVMMICRVSLKKLLPGHADFATCRQVNVKQSFGKCREQEQQSSPGLWGG